MVQARKSATPPAESGPCWDVARLFPTQGHWTAGDYLSLSEQTNGRIELVDGNLEVLELPSLIHQMLIQAVLQVFHEFCVRSGVGRAVVAGYPLRIAGEHFRQPDVLLIPKRDDSRTHDDFCEFAYVVVEVISKDRNRDLVEKRRDYARGGIPEYWIVDPQNRSVEVLRLSEDRYVSHGLWREQETAISAQYSELKIDVSALFAAAN